MLVLTTAGTPGKLPKVLVTLDGKEIDALLSGGSQRFPVPIGEVTHDVEIIAASTKPRTPKPDIRLRVADDALGAARIGTVTPLFPDRIPFTLILMCSDPAPAKARLGKGVTYERIDLRADGARPPAREDLPLAHRVGIAVALGAIVAGAGFLQGRDAPLYYLVAIGLVLWSIFGKTHPSEH